MSETRLKAPDRVEFGKGASRRLRRDNLVPAVIYAHDNAPVRHVALPAHDLQLALKNSNVLLELELSDGVQLALPKAVQRHPFRPIIEHVDLVAVRRGEKVVVEIPVTLEGQLVAGGLVDHVNDRIAVEAEATHIPESLIASLEGLEIGDSITAKDVVLPSGTTLVAEPDLVVVHITTAKVAVEEEPETEEEQPVEGEEPPAAES